MTDDRFPLRFPESGGFFMAFCFLWPIDLTKTLQTTKEKTRGETSAFLRKLNPTSILSSGLRTERQTTDRDRERWNRQQFFEHLGTERERERRQFLRQQFSSLNTLAKVGLARIALLKLIGHLPPVPEHRERRQSVIKSERIGKKLHLGPSSLVSVSLLPGGS